MYRDTIKGCTTLDELESKILDEKTSINLKYFSIDLKINPIINYKALKRIQFSSHCFRNGCYIGVDSKYFNFLYPNVDVDDIYPVDCGIMKENLFNNLPIKFCYISKLEFWIGSNSQRTGCTIPFEEVVRFEDFFYELERLGLISYTNDNQGYLFTECLDRFNNFKTQCIDLLDEEFPQYGKTAKMKFLTK